MAIRSERYANQAGVRALEQEQDNSEGSARFAEDQFVRLGKQVTVHDSAAPDDPKALFFHLAGGRSYPIGAAIGELLEKTSGRSWRNMIEKGVSPYDAAAKLVGIPTGAERAGLVDAAKKFFDFPKLMAKIAHARLPDLDLG